ncbi:MAG: right-handed parallel beta-helix repeat-containing protein, partial [Dehalococcoidia bacterium]
MRKMSRRQVLSLGGGLGALLTAPSLAAQSVFRLRLSRFVASPTQQPLAERGSAIAPWSTADAATTPAMATLATANLILRVTGDGDSTPPTLTDTYGNTWVFIRSTQTTTGSPPAWLWEWMALNGVGGAGHTVTATKTGAYPTIALTEITGTAIGLIDHSGVADSTSPFTTPVVTTTAPALLLAAFAPSPAEDPLFTATPGDSFATTVENYAGWGLALAKRSVTPATDYQVSWTHSGGAAPDGWAVSLLAFQDNGNPGSPPGGAIGPPEAGPTIYVTTAAGLHAALSGITGPCVIRIAPGTYTGNFILPNRTIGASSWVIIRADTPDANLTPSTKPWILPAQAPYMAKLVALDTLLPALDCEDGANGFWLAGIEFLPNPSNPDRDLCILGRGNMTSVSQMPNRITFQSTYFHADPAVGGHRGLLFNVSNGTVRESYFSGFWESGRDSQAIVVVNGAGSIDVLNSYLEASGENMMFGGGDPSITNQVPADITIRGNHFFKPLAWTAHAGSVKNLFELKNAKRVTIENNVFENCWIDAQSGHGIVFTVRNQDGTAPWSTVEDVTFRYNIIKNVDGAAINLLGKDDINTSVQGTNMVIEHNLCIDCVHGLSLNNCYRPITIRHNTWPTLVGRFMYWIATVMPSGNLFCKDNVVGASEYGILADGYS